MLDDQVLTAQLKELLKHSSSYSETAIEKDIGRLRETNLNFATFADQVIDAVRQRRGDTNLDQKRQLVPLLDDDNSVTGNSSSDDNTVEAEEDVSGIAEPSYHSPLAS